MAIDVEMIQEDIDMGVRFNPWGCPIARAIQRVTKCDHVAVVSQIEIDGSKYQTPQSVSELIYKFDTGMFVEPISFRLLTREDMLN